MDVARAFLRSEPLERETERETYVQWPKGVEDDKVAWELMKPLYGLSTACNDGCETLRKFPAGECGGGKVTSLARFVFFSDATRIPL